MKKTIIFLAVLGLFTFATPKIADAAPDCIEVTVWCSKDKGCYTMICSWEDLIFITDHCCGANE